MAGATEKAGASPRGLRGLTTDYRTRLLLAILFVVAVALLLVLLALPRLLEGYFLDQERRTLAARASTMAQLVAAELAQVASGGVVDAPILVPLQYPVDEPADLAPGESMTRALGDGEGGFVRDLARDIALADVTITLAPEPGSEAVYHLDVPMPDSDAEPGQDREDISVTATREVRDPWWSASEEAAPVRELNVTLSDPFTFRQQTSRTITEVLLTAAFIALVVALITALLLAQWLTRPIRRLTRTSRLLAEGHLDARVEMPANAAPEVQELAGAFNEMAERLEESVTIIREDRDRGREFLADVSHELRTPIAALRTFNELLLDGAAEDPSTRDEFLRQSRQQVERLDWLATNLLELSRLDSGLVALDTRVADVRSVAQDAVEHAEPMARRKGVGLSLQMPDVAVVVEHDPPRVGQVLANLIGNGIKFTPAGGHVEVSVAATPDGARLEVRDDGVGIDPGEIEHVFDRFYRGTRTPSERAGGSGLGLAIVRSIVDMHAGRVSISSIPDQGTTVVVDLPRVVSVSSPATPRG